MYRSWSDVERLIQRVLAETNSGTELVTGQITLSEFVEGHYLPWCEQNKAAATVKGYPTLA